MTPPLEDYRALIESVLVRTGTHAFEDIERAVAEGAMQFWPGERSVILTEIVEYPLVRELNCVVAAGNLAELEAMHPMVEAWGRGQGCERAVFTGRRGWERTFLSREGYKQTMIVMEKAL